MRTSADTLANIALRRLAIAVWLIIGSMAISGCTNTGASEPAGDPVSQPQTARPRGSH